MLDKLLNKINRIRPGFFTRVGNIVIVQVLFVFAALALLLFLPGQKDVAQNDYSDLLKGYDETSQIIMGSLNKHDETDLIDVDSLRKTIADLTEFNPIEIVLFEDVDNNGSGTPRIIYTDEEKLEDEDKIEFNIVNLLFENNRSNLITRFPDKDNFVHYYNFERGDNDRFVLAVVYEHDLIVSSWRVVQIPLLIIFLASTLVSLLVILLIKNKFKEPLIRLTRSVEKSMTGEICYTITPESDKELNELGRSFNSISQSLFDNERALKKTSRKLRASIDFLNLIIDSSPDSVITTDLSGKITLLNKRALVDFKIDVNDIQDLNINRLLTHKVEDITSFDPDKQLNKLETLCRRSDGTLFPAYVNFVRIDSLENEINGHLYIIRDISESRGFQDMMVRLDRYYTKGEMAGDIAHEINNFLAILSGNLELLPLYLKKNDPDMIDKKLDLMRTTVDKIVKFTDGLLDVGEDSTNFVKYDLNHLVKTVIEFLKPQNKYDFVEIFTDLSTEIPLIPIDIGQMQQLLVNLINNSAEAFDPKAENKIIKISTSYAPGSSDSLMIKVQDNGPGVVEDKMAHLFKKRFTTKKKGHGIGLVTCRRIIDSHKGRIEYSFENGAAFSVILHLNPNATALENIARKESVLN